jgi:hypothetical protein
LSQFPVSIAEVTFTIKPRATKDGFDLESEALSHGGLWYGEVRQAVSYARHRAGSKPATIQVFDEAGHIIETIEHNPNTRDGAGTLGVI